MRAPENPASLWEHWESGGGAKALLCLSGKSPSPADHMMGGGGSTSLEAKHPGLEQPWKHLIPLARVFFTMDSVGTMNIALKSCLEDAFHSDIQLSLIAAVTSTSEDGSEPSRGKRAVSRSSRQTGLKKTHFTVGRGG